MLLVVIFAHSQLVVVRVRVKIAARAPREMRVSAIYALTPCARRV